MSFGKAWSDEENRILRDEWAAGTLISDIAKLIGRQPNSVKNRADHLNLPPRRRTTACLTLEERKARKQAENKRTQERKRALKPAGVTQAWPQADIDMLRKLYLAWVPASQIAQQIGRPIKAVTGKIQRLKLKRAPLVVQAPKPVGPVREASYHTIAQWAEGYGLPVSATHGFDLAGINAFRAQHGLAPFAIRRAASTKNRFAYGAQQR